MTDRSLIFSAPMVRALLEGRKSMTRRLDVKKWKNAKPGERVWVRETAIMPRWASRLTLIVESVKIERLQDISEEDAIAEGVYYSPPTEQDMEWYRDYCAEQGCEPSEPMQGVWMAPGTRQGWGLTKAERNKEQWGPTAQFAFGLIWESLHGRGSWDVNRFVAAISFTVVKANIDSLPKEAA